MMLQVFRERSRTNTQCPPHPLLSISAHSNNVTGHIAKMRTFFSSPGWIFLCFWSPKCTAALSKVVAHGPPTPSSTGCNYHSFAICTSKTLPAVLRTTLTLVAFYPIAISQELFPRSWNTQILNSSWNLLTISCYMWTLCMPNSKRRT